jgi:predicted enzyme related to lactoylglutathione lyase
MLRLNHITFAADDPQRLAAFWAELLGYETSRLDAAAFARGDGPELCFKRMPKSPTIEVPIHLDVNVADREAEVRRALEHGARLVAARANEIGGLSETWTIMRDPEGNGFCIQAPPRTEAPYIGNVTFSSAAPRKLGAFWSAALGWPEQEAPPGFLDMLLAAGLDPNELDGYYATMNPDGTRPRLLFQRREKSRPEHYPIHVDFVTDDQDAEVERLVGLGAHVAKRRGRTVLRDPEGNPFCVE